MASHIRDTRPVTRKVTTAHGKALIITLTPDGISVREPRRRKSFLLPYGVAFLQAIRIDVAAQPRRRTRVRRGLL